jgi:hypothetical protein
MSRFLKVFLRDPLGGRIHIAGFGKHPAWDDHIDDIGLATETLVLTKKLLYSEGIATQLASGAWDQIEKSRQAIEFDHRFVWGRDQQAIVGAIWASADRKGRTRFPMVICVQAGFDGHRAIGILLAPVERLGMLCREGKTQEKIRDSFNQTYRELNGALFPAAAGNLFSETIDPGENSILPALITLSAGLRSQRPRSSGETGRSGRSHFRLTTISSHVKENFSFWAGFLARYYDPTLPYIIIAANGRSWIDLIVGEPVPGDFFCLRGNEYALPATWIGIEGAQLRKLEAEAKDYLQTFRHGTASTVKHPRTWWGGLFKPKLRD